MVCHFFLFFFSVACIRAVYAVYAAVHWVMRARCGRVKRALTVCDWVNGRPCARAKEVAKREATAAAAAAAAAKSPKKPPPSPPAVEKPKASNLSILDDDDDDDIDEDWGMD